VEIGKCGIEKEGIEKDGIEVEIETVLNKEEEMCLLFIGMRNVNVLPVLIVLSLNVKRLKRNVLRIKNEKR
jgi:hypothetical protein